MILVVSRGACPRKAIELIGFTSKGDGNATIGRFGSGTAYAIALALRRGVLVTISSCDENGPYEVEPYLKDVSVGQASARQILWRYRRGSRLISTWRDSVAKALGRVWSVASSFSSELGAKDWQGGFPIVREFVCNARDADPEGFRVWREGAPEADLNLYKDLAVVDGHTAVTIVRLGSPIWDDDPVDAVLDQWDEHFRFGDDRPSVYRSGAFTAVYAKPTKSPLKLFVKGVRCPWPSSRVPESFYDYSLDLKLTESRAIHDQFMANYVMSNLWSKIAVDQSRLFEEFIRRISFGEDGWESTEFNEHIHVSEIPAVGSRVSPRAAILTAWTNVHGAAPVTEVGEARANNDIVIAPAFKRFLVRTGVEPSVEAARVMAPRKPEPSHLGRPRVDRIRLPLTVEEAGKLLSLLRISPHTDPELLDMAATLEDYGIERIPLDGTQPEEDGDDDGQEPCGEQDDPDWVNNAWAEQLGADGIHEEDAPGDPPGGSVPEGSGMPDGGTFWDDTR